jgi:hypothetical protein
VSERISRPPIKLKAAQPDGSNNGLGRAASHFLGPDSKDSRFLIVEVGRQELVHKDASGADVAVLEILKVAMPAAQQDLAAMLGDCLAADFEGTVPAFPVTDRGKYEAKLDAWAEQNGFNPAKVREEWEEHFGPDAPPGPTGALMEHLVEFVLEVAGAPDEEDTAPDGPMP